ncbi:MAG: hypothetical protein JO287_02290 [Pseudonocardiales bacterium]|nr:hypothetical protein [Pseudonocardiales bacterium]
MRIAVSDGGFSGAELLTAAEFGGAGGAFDTMSGRMVVGGTTAADLDALFNDGHVRPLDVATGASEEPSDQP